MAYEQPKVDVAAVTAVLDGKYVDVRNLVRTNLAQAAGILEDQENLGTDEFRDRVRDLVVEMAATGQTGMGFPEEYGGGGDIGASIAAFETLAFGDLSVLVKVGVQFGLFGGAILQLGTKRHHDALLADLITGRLMGCFAMTETGHGSNVQALGTTATYDAATQEFVIHTPDDLSRKDYIGNAARHADVAVVFAQLEINGSSEGVHAFVVPLREDGAVLPGVRIEDDGPKMGLNGVDNGRIWFDRVRVPRDALLNQFADVTAEGALRVGHREPQPALLHDARHAGAGPGLRRRRLDQRGEGRADHRDPVRRPAPAVRGHLRGGAAAARLRHAPAPAAAAAGPHVRAALRAGGGGRRPARGVLRRGRRGARPAGARVAGGRDQGARHLARHPDHPGVPRGVRRRGLPVDQPVRRAEGRHGRLHDVRGRQPRAAAAGRQGAAHRLLQRLLRPRPARDGAVRGRDGRRDRGRADQRAQAARADPRRTARRRRLGPGGRAARPELPARDVPLPRGAHAGRRGPSPQARHRRRG